MNFLSIIVISLGLSVDSFTASVGTGVCMSKIVLKKALKIAVFMSLFQGLMPLVGWLAGVGFKDYIVQIDHWFAFVLLSFIGVKMVYEGINKDVKKCFCPSNTMMLIGMSLATSIDALIVGIGFGILNVPIILPVIIITIITFIFSLTGIYLGRKIGKRFNSGIEIVGGILLFTLGTKILIEHLYFID